MKNEKVPTRAVRGGEDAEHDVLVQGALEIATQSVQHAFVLDSEVQHLWSRGDGQFMNRGNTREFSNK